jgi:trehalose-phosphatase
MAEPLPRGLITQQLAQGRMLLCLDYDGTLAEISTDPLRAYPLTRAKNVLAELTRFSGRIAVAIVSGRDLDTLRRLLGLSDGLLFAGIHGLEFIGCDGRHCHAPGVDECAADLDRLRDYIARSIAQRRGFIVEDKGLSLTLNYRNADPDEARAVIAGFERFVAERVPSFRVMEGKMIREALPRCADGKGAAIKFFMEDTGVPASRAVYIGDDVTDEDAFAALRKSGGITVRVGPERPTLAQYRLETPAEVAGLLEEIAAGIRKLSATSG